MILIDFSRITTLYPGILLRRHRLLLNNRILPLPCSDCDYGLEHIVGMNIFIKLVTYFYFILLDLLHIISFSYNTSYIIIQYKTNVNNVQHEKYNKEKPSICVICGENIYDFGLEYIIGMNISIKFVMNSYFILLDLLPSISFSYSTSKIFIQYKTCVNNVQLEIYNKEKPFMCVICENNIRSIYSVEVICI